jgi:hypothetical protein
LVINPSLPSISSADVAKSCPAALLTKGDVVRLKKVIAAVFLRKVRLF